MLLIFRNTKTLSYHLGHGRQPGVTFEFRKEAQELILSTLSLSDERGWTSITSPLNLFPLERQFTNHCQKYFFLHF